MTSDTEHQALLSGLDRLAAETLNWSSSLRGERVLRAVVGIPYGEAGLYGILYRHTPDRNDYCERCPGKVVLWRECPEVKVVRVALVVSGVMRS